MTLKFLKDDQGTPGEASITCGVLGVYLQKLPALLAKKVKGGRGRWGRVGHAAGLEELGPRKLALRMVLPAPYDLTIRSPHSGDKGGYYGTC